MRASSSGKESKDVTGEEAIAMVVPSVLNYKLSFFYFVILFTFRRVCCYTSTSPVLARIPVIVDLG